MLQKVLLVLSLQRAPGYSQGMLLPLCRFLLPLEENPASDWTQLLISLSPSKPMGMSLSLVVEKRLGPQ